MKKLFGFMLWLPVACAPTLSGQLHGSSTNPWGPDARINITELNPIKKDPASHANYHNLVLLVDADGHFATREPLPAGEYLIEALVPGYASESQRLNLAVTNHVELSLKPLTSAPVRANQLNSTLEEGRGAGGATLAPPSL